MPLFPYYRQTAVPGPLFALPGLTKALGLSARLFAMADWQGPTGTQHYRVAGAMLDMALDRRDIAPGGSAAEAAEPLFALGFAAAAAARGLFPHLFFPEGAPDALLARLAALGATARLTPSRGGWPAAMDAARGWAKATGGLYLNHTQSDDEVQVHRQTTGPALYEGLSRQIDVFVAGVGSGGAFSGTAEFLKGWLPDIHAVAVQPAESPVLTGGFAARHGITGLGLPFAPENFNPYAADEILSVSTGDAEGMASLVLKTDGVPAAVSAGAALAAAVRLAARPAYAGAVIAVLLDAAVPL